MPKNTDVLKKIEEYASLFMTPVDIARLIKHDKKIFFKLISDENSDFSKAYYKGKLESMVELRKTTLRMAKHGSPAAEETMIKYLQKQHNAESDL